MTTAPTAAPRRDTRRPPIADANATLSIHPRGFGFANCDDGISAFIQPALANGLLDGDRIRVVVRDDGDGRHSATSCVLVERTRTELFGTAAIVDGVLSVIGDAAVTNTTFPIDGVAADGSGVLCTWRNERWVVTDTYPEVTSLDALRRRVMARHRLHVDDITDHDIPLTLPAPGGRRVDLRDLPTWTVDADKSRDLDDAISVTAAEPDGAIRVWVHIADVAEIVTPGSSLDDQAREFATSAYLPGDVRPMLPRSLSEDALSLLPDVDRNCLTVEMRIDRAGHVTAADIYESTIRSNGRLNYHTVGAVLEGHGTVDGDDETTALEWLRTIRGGIENRRVEPERVIHVDGDEATFDAETINRGHQMIERLMVATNETVAAWLFARGVPTLYRTHDAPGDGATDAIEDYVAAIGLRCGFGGRLDDTDLAVLDTQLSTFDGPVADGIWSVLLGHLGRASYTPHAGQHFGLGSELYVHFTSPIRRYADIVVHRGVKAYLAGVRGRDEQPSIDELAELGAHLGARSRDAARAESDMRAAVWLRELADQPAGQRSGTVTGVGPSAVYITLDDCDIAGKLPYSDLPGRWEPNDTRTAAAANDGRRVSIGDHVAVTITTADPCTGDLTLATTNNRRRRRRPTRR